MLKIENCEVTGWEAAIRGMRNPKNSWGKSDSDYCEILGELTNENMCYRCAGCKNEFTSRPNCVVIGPNDHDLMMRLRNAGTDHRKFMRMIIVYVDIIAPLYWWKEYDTYKVGTVANSCSTMHKIADKEFAIEDFSCEHLLDIETLRTTIRRLNLWRTLYLEGGHEESQLTPTAYDVFLPKDKRCWWQMIQLLPSSYNQKRTVMLNYEVLANMYKSRRNHKLDEWHTLCEWMEKLPYSELIIGEREQK